MVYYIIIKDIYKMIKNQKKYQFNSMLLKKNLKAKRKNYKKYQIIIIKIKIQKLIFIYLIILHYNGLNLLKMVN